MILESFEKISVYNDHIQNDSNAEAFKPPGELLETYTSKGRHFEIWSGELTDPAVKLLISRMQILISFFIEGGTPLELDDQEWSLARWRVYFVYVAPSSTFASAYGITAMKRLRRLCRGLLHTQSSDILPHTALLHTHQVL